MLTVHIAGAPDRLVQRCFRCNRVLIDYRRAMVPTGQGFGWWATGAFVGVTHDTFPVGSMAMERDAQGDDEQACECPPADVDVRPVEAYQ